ncbi:hypothetical protein RTH74_18245 [Pseudomonas sp. zfem001]|uniref:hypothetical protein n=1 Tax=Pseudomonas sp. zfem001 TaxID=3078196 RepID=UPI00292985AC|nr:hypothetical protein [Pseudomonas sp. zfem001]MDU9409553.1 hypothetical protein [Pseudomonas sp. zfem001]
MKDWLEVNEEFAVDGSLRDIYVLDVCVDVWNEFIKKVKNESFEFKFVHGSSERALPDNFYKIKELQQTNPTTLCIWLDNNIKVNCHFFMETEIELDISPREIRSLAEYKILTSFMKWLSNILRKPAILTHEGSQDQVILSVNESVV